MFAKVMNGIINHYRGDTLSTPIYIYQDNVLTATPYYIGKGDTLFFCITEPKQAFEDAIVKKVFDENSEKDAHGNIILNLKSTDTEYLLPGKYYYSIRLKHEQGNSCEIKTILPPTIFNILGEIPKDTTADDFDSNIIILDGGEII